MKSKPRNPLTADFDAIYQRHSREVWALVYARWLNADVALDIMQETFLRLWKQGQEGATVQNPRAWLLRVARNLAEDHAKSSFRRFGTQPPQTMHAVHDRERQPLERMAHDETARELRAELAKLAESDREILSLRYALDYSTEEIADALQINATAVHMRLSRARQRLAERLLEQGVREQP